MFKKAQRNERPLKIVLFGRSGSGKTYTALRIAHLISDSVFVIDTESNSSSIYADHESDGKVWSFQVAKLDTYSVDYYIAAIDAAEKAGAKVLVIDSLTHAWDSENGILDFVDKVAKQKDGNGKERGSFTAWKDGSAAYKKLMKKIIDSPMHIFATLRSKVEYVVEKDDRGKTSIRKVGLKPIMRDGIDYEFDIALNMDAGTAFVDKTHCPQLPEGTAFHCPGPELAETLWNWYLASTNFPVPEAVLEEDPGIGPEFTADDARKQIRELISNGKATSDDVIHWRTVHSIPAGEKLSDEQSIQLASDLAQYVQSGRWVDMPF